MKRKKIATALVAFVLLTSSLTACNLFGKGGGGSSAPSSSQSTIVSSEPASSTQSSELARSTVSDVSSTASSSPETDQQVFPIVTDSKAFDALFKQNPIDTAYISDSGNAYTNVAMVQVAEKYSKLWQSEIDSAYIKLLSLANTSDKNSLKSEQEKWVNATPAALDKINKDAQAAGGSLAQVNASSRVMDYYRTRAAHIYRELYTYDKNYSYNFKK